MTRLIEIIDDSLNVEGSLKAEGSIKEISSDDLPLAIYTSIDQPGCDKNSIIISSINDSEEGNKNILGYISQYDEHIYFQPEVKNSSNTIFHNDEIVKNSVWLKSGDSIQYQRKIISYSISGDRIKISVADVSEIPNIASLNTASPEPHEKINNQFHNKNIYNAHVKGNIDKNNKIKKSIFLIFFILLAFTAAFILFAQTIVINIDPEPDNIDLKGFFPNIKIDNRYLVISGKYKLTAEKQGYRVLQEVIHITETNKNFSFFMKENPGFIEFKIKPEDHNKIYIDDKLLGDAGNTLSLIKYEGSQYEIDKGDYILRIVNPRYKEYKQKIKIEGKNKHQTYQINLLPNWGNILIDSKFENTKIEIYSAANKDEVIFESILNGSKEIELISGEYIIYASKENYKDKEINFTIQAEQNLKLETVVLEFKDGILDINSSPTGSVIRIDGQYLGQTPKQIKLSPYTEHALELSRSGYKTIYKKINLQADVIYEENIKLKANSGLVFISVSPKHAKLFINGQQQKENSGQFNLTGKNNILIVKADSYQTQTKNISVSSYSKNISFILLKNNTKNKSKNTQLSNKNKIIPNKLNYINSIGQKMIKVRPAIFMMGSKKNESGRGSNESEHKIQITYHYYMSDKEVSNKQYREFKNSHHSGSSANKTLNSNNQPVVNVTWNDAAGFSNWLSLKESLPPYYREEKGKMIPLNINADIQGYRLPFEAEWALSARGIKQKKYPWSGNYPPGSVSGNYADDSASSHIANTITAYNDRHSVTAPIGTYAKNESGFYDLGGNVSEWCEDYYSPSAGLSANKLLVNPKGSKKGTHHVVRDASWRDASIREVRLSYRSYSKKKSNDIGFRLVRYAP